MDFGDSGQLVKYFNNKMSKIAQEWEKYFNQQISQESIESSIEKHEKLLENPLRPKKYMKFMEFKSTKKLQEIFSLGLDKERDFVK